MNINKISFSAMDFAAIGTWLAIFGITLYIMPNANEQVQQNANWIIAFFLTYALCLITVLQSRLSQINPTLRIAIFLVQLLSAFGILLLWQLDFLSILTVLWVALLPSFFSIRQSLVITVVVLILWFSLRAYLWGSRGILIHAALYSCFHLFAILMSHHAKMAENANQKAQRLNQQLIATQQLLTEATRQNERTRIARDLHDLLGHHLTALIINLQVASHLSEGEAKEKITQCHSLAKLLLGDVREAVSVLRENQQLNFHSMINMITRYVPTIKVISNINTDFRLDDLSIAKTLLNCIQEGLTNSMRHSKASQFWINLEHKSGLFHLELFDDGKMTKNRLVEGNGLIGMRERIKELSGNIEIDSSNGFVKITIDIPSTTISTTTNNINEPQKEKLTDA